MVDDDADIGEEGRPTCTVALGKARCCIPPHGIGTAAAAGPIGFDGGGTGGGGGASCNCG